MGKDKDKNFHFFFHFFCKFFVEKIKILKILSTVVISDRSIPTRFSHSPNNPALHLRPHLAGLCMKIFLFEISPQQNLYAAGTWGSGGTMALARHWEGPHPRPAESGFDSLTVGCWSVLLCSVWTMLRIGWIW